MKTYCKFILFAFCVLCFGLKAKPINDCFNVQKSNFLKDEKKWQSTTVISTGLTVGAFSQQYYKYLSTEIFLPGFLDIPFREYEYSIIRYNYILPSIGFNKIYAKNIHQNYGISFELQPGVAYSKNNAIMSGILTSRFVFNKKYWGLGIGLSIGNRLFNEDVFSGGYDKYAKTSYSNIRILPDLRLGRLDIFYFEVSRMKPVTLDAIDYFYGIGTGFGSTNKYAIRIGYSTKNQRNGKYIDIKIPVNKNNFLNVFGGYSKNVKRDLAIAPDSELHNEINTNAWFTGFKMNWCL